MNPQPIMAIDPGDEYSAYVLFDGRIPEVSESVEQIHNDALLGMLRTMPYTYPLFIEEITNYGMAVGNNIFHTIHWSGRFREAWESKGRMVTDVPRRLIKQHLCNSHKATDANVRQALINKLGQPGTMKSPGVTYMLKSHAWQALAIAVYAHDNGLQNAQRKTEEAARSMA